MSLSIGGAVSLKTTGRNLEELIILADKALYKAKELGRNSVHVEESKPVKRVLLADNDPSTVEKLGKTLSHHCQLLTTDNGVDCVELVKRTQPDLILLDENLPKMDGSEVCQTLKQLHETAAIPIILVSSLNREERLSLGKEAGANDSLQKPLNEQHLLSKICQYLR